MILSNNVPEPHPDVPMTHGDVRFASTDERDAASVRLERAGIIVAELEGIGPSARGRLAEVISETIEQALVARGATGAEVTGLPDREATLSDQLFRARRVGATGIAVVLGPLRAAAGICGTLHPSDCATLRFLAGAARDRPLTLFLDDRDAQTAAYGDPVALSQLIPANDWTSTTAISTSTSTSTSSGDDTWRTWTLKLVAARGPQPLATLEHLFAEAYVPLSNAIIGGLDDPRACRARDEFSDSFATGYADAFPTFAATTKRPRMVLDVHDAASRIARLHGARTMRPLLVDAMRWDVSRLIEAAVVARLGVRAALTDQLLLWSALPTTTIRQLETIARGFEALRAPATLEDDPQPARGRNAEHVRRMRVGPRELYKLDIVQSRVQAALGDVARELPEIADAAAEAIVRHVETLAPRTLLFVFGDHGFTIDKRGVACQGGASPEEVLVGGFALLIGDVH
ncbi:MAG: hypothetical protein M3O46_08080 [Myxococcota bacterium]|nr:hypothetical protein [Myxococcota bacterium]